MRRSALSVLLVVSAAFVGIGMAESAGATGPASAPTPGTASQIEKLVAASSGITSIPSSPDPSLSAEDADSANLWYPETLHGCTDLVSDPCVFGDTTSKKTVVLFGDSHAQMWLSALVPAAKALKVRLVLFWFGGCPAASVTVYLTTSLDGFPAGPYLACNNWRKTVLKTIKKLRPELVLLSNRTAMVNSGPNSYFTATQWKAGVKTTVDAIKSKATKVAIIGDIVYMPYQMPACLDANPTNVQYCAAPNPNTMSHSNEPAEVAEAKTLHIGYINPLPWICTKTCSPVIGNFLVYLDEAHLDETYVAFLATVMQEAVKPLL